jgi:hypothetical protein
MPNSTVVSPVGGPALRAWREGTLTRAKELESLTIWAAQRPPDTGSTALIESIGVHLSAAREAALARRRLGDKAACSWWHWSGCPARLSQPRRPSEASAGRPSRMVYRLPSPS